MRIAIDSGSTKSGHSIRGVGMYTSELIKALGKNVSAVDFNKRDLSNYDIIHYTYFDLFSNTLKIYPRIKTVVTVHDVIPLIYPNHYPPGLKGKMNLLFQKRALRRVNAVITDTETSKKDIIRLLGIKENKVHVVYLAPKKIFRKLEKKSLEKIREKYSLPSKFVLYVGDINYNKNIPNLVKACTIARLPLVICGKQALDVDDLGNDLRALKGPRDWMRFLFGKPHPELAHYKEILRGFSESGNVMRLGFVPDNDLVAIYNLAYTYCQPSLYEGFGLPVLEAMACGTSVVAAKTQALVEIAGNAATFVNPLDPKDIAKGFNNLKKEIKLPRTYSWEQTAKETREVYEEI